MKTKNESECWADARNVLEFHWHYGGEPNGKTQTHLTISVPGKRISIQTSRQITDALTEHAALVAVAEAASDYRNKNYGPTEGHNLNKALANLAAVRGETKD